MDAVRWGEAVNINHWREAKAIILANGGATTEEIALKLGVSQVRPLL